MHICFKSNVKKSQCIIALTGGLLFMLIFGCGVYVSDYYRADGAALAALTSDEVVWVKQEENTVAFIPESPTAGFLFYPGGKVEFTAYAPLMHMLAEQDILCVLIEMPYNLAVLDINAAEGIQEQYPQVTRWFIGGHSLGGSMAANYAVNSTEDYIGLVLLASYSTEDVRDTGMKVVSVIGSEDQVLDMKKYRKYSSMLPNDTEEIIIEGGCHAYFGSYGSQTGDGNPAITALKQIEKTTQILTEFFS